LLSQAFDLAAKIGDTSSKTDTLVRACWISLQIEPRCHRARKMVTSEISFRF
jgi:hypothetical protein